MTRTRRWFGALAPPHALQVRLQWFLLGINLLCLVTYLPSVVAAPDRGVALRAATCLAIVAVGAWWVRGYRRGSFPLWGIPLEVATFAAIVLVPHDPVNAVTLAYFAAMFRSLQHSWPCTVVVVAVFTATFVAATLLAPSLGGVDRTSLVPAAYPGVPVFAAVMALTFSSAARADRAMARERLLSRTGLAIARARDEESVRSVSRDAVHTLLAGTPGARARLLPAGRHVDPPPGAACLDLPVPGGEGGDRVLRVVSDAPIAEELISALSVLTAQLAVALAWSTLTQDLARRAEEDPLTGLANRRCLDAALGDAIDRRVRPRELAVLTLDLDGFKAVNDTHGHGVGDGLLVAVAGRLLAEVREEDLVARVGGDEFLVLLCGAQAGARAVAVAGRLVIAVARPFRVGGHEVHVGASVGVAVDRGGGAREVLEASDRAMYRAKHAGRGRVVVDHGPVGAALAVRGAPT